ncbi:uncharacterized protein LOC127845671 [Dreissena polymorpha]|uniref:uncharacterized protein LOC127845671 n=1 Tax=Dreissena polymorpha TaxID=45954 RepID=UPI0022653D35|nr:uncharacterized protein LOC127845671 [Dreissena polymorpha]
MYGSSIGRLNVYQVNNGGLPGKLVWSLTGDQGNSWKEGQVPLNSNQSYSILLSGVIGNGFQGDIAVDDINLSVGYCEVKPSSASRTDVTNTTTTPVDGTLSAWGSWDACSKSCANGTQSRHRTCDYSPPTAPHGKPCSGSLKETIICNTEKCPIAGHWSNWTNFTACSVTCAGGTHTRNRTCIFDDPEAPHCSECFGNTTDTHNCNTQSCPVCARNFLSAADYESDWVSIEAYHPTQAVLTFPHGLGEVPLLVDVSIKSTNGPNKDFIFSAIGSQPRDDDIPQQWGGVVYFYNKSHVIVSAPTQSNTVAILGHVIYTDNTSFYAGPNADSVDIALVRVRAWRVSTLPLPAWKVTGIPVGFNRPDLLIEEPHPLNEHPVLVVVRTRITGGTLAGYVSDTVGASYLTRDNEDATYCSGYIISGFSDKAVRVWTNSHGCSIAAGNDGYFGNKSLHGGRGDLEIFAWSASSLSNAFSIAGYLGPSVENESLELPLTTATHSSFVRSWVESMNGPNAGFRFIGAGAASPFATKTDPVCTYGGLVFAYKESLARMWRPLVSGNGGLICVPEAFGNGTHSQLDHGGKVVINVWSTMPIEPYHWVEPQHMCMHTKIP